MFCVGSDGANQMITGCMRDFRNKPFSTKAKIEYYKNTLTVSERVILDRIEKNETRVLIRELRTFLGIVSQR